MAETKDQTVTGSVTLDDNTFVNVAFKDATLTYSGGRPPSFANCSFDTVQFQFEGQANNTLHFLRAMAPTSSNMREVVHGLIPELKD